MRWFRFFAYTLFVALCARLFHGLHGTPAIIWMNIYQVTDFKNLSDIFRFLADLQAPIPPVISLTEILNYWSGGDGAGFDNIFYWLSLTLSMLLAVHVTSTTQASIIINLLLSMLLMQSIFIIHPGNPQVYDLYYPFFMIVSLFCLWQAKSNETRGMDIVYALLAGFFLSMAELTRPFVLYIVPIIAMLFCCALRRKPKYLLWAALPFLLISGVWHLHMAMDHHALTWSNHVGYNISRAWPHDPVDLQLEPAGGSNEGGHGANLNTDIHADNSRKLKKSVIDYARAHPQEVAQNAYERLRNFALVTTELSGSPQPEPRHKDLILKVYRIYLWAAMLIAVMVIVKTFLFPVMKIIVRRLPLGEGFGGIVFQSATVAIISGILMAFGEKGEEARFMISIVPLLAVPLFWALDDVIALSVLTSGRER